MFQLKYCVPFLFLAKGKAVFVINKRQSMKTHDSTRWSWVASFTLRTLDSREKKPPATTD